MIVSNKSRSCASRPLASASRPLSDEAWQLQNTAPTAAAEASRQTASNPITASSGLADGVCGAWTKFQQAQTNSTAMIKTTASNNRFGNSRSCAPSLGGGKINSIGCPPFEGRTSSAKGNSFKLLVAFMNQNARTTVRPNKALRLKSRLSALTIRPHKDCLFSKPVQAIRH